MSSYLKVLKDITDLLDKNKQVILNGPPGTGKTYLAKQVAKLLININNEGKLNGLKNGTYDKLFEAHTKLLELEKKVDGTQNEDTQNEETALNDIKNDIQNVIENLPNKESNNGGAKTKAQKMLDALDALDDIKKDDIKKVIHVIKEEFEEFIEAIKKTEVNDYCEFVQFHPSYDYTDFIEGIRPKLESEGSTESTIVFTLNKGPSTEDYTFTIDENNRAELSKMFGDNISFELRNGIFKKFCKRAKAKSDEKDEKYVFIIDEINRAELSKVFGEIFYSIEPDYRGKEGRVKTQYASLNTGEEAVHTENGEHYFFVPENVYIIGTMNDIDRSVEVFDFALRRRFAWFEVAVTDEQHMFGEDYFAEVLKAMLEINDRVLNGDDGFKGLVKKAKVLNDKIVKEVGKEYGLDKRYAIGPAYFAKVEVVTGETGYDYQKLWDNHLEPLLKEYVRGQRDANNFIEGCKGVIL